MSIHHRIDYIEIAVHDVAAAKAFYGAAFGWSFNDYGPEYAGIVGADREQGGLCKGAPVTGAGPLVILHSDTLEASQDAVLAAGGRVHKEIFAFPGGRRFEFTDPSGNALGVWSQG